MEMMPWLGSGSMSKKSKKSKTAVGIDFSSEEGLDGWDVLKMRILEQAMVDYTKAYKYLSRIKKLPADFSKWTDKDYRLAYQHISDIRTIYEVQRFLKSKWFATLYSDLDPDQIRDTLQNKCKATYGALIGHDRIDKIRAALKKWLVTSAPYKRKGLRNG